jgi:potassium-transporting ATPase KdpC subunit
MKTLRPALTLLALFTVLTGLLYPLAVTGASAVFASQRHGSLVMKNGVTVGSRLIGQPFTNAGHFWGRPSATTPASNGGASSGSNLGPTNKAGLLDSVADRIKALKDADPTNSDPVPVDLVTASGSGLDPDISPAAAYYQVHRVALARQLDEAKVRALVDSHIQGRTLGVLGERRVNVLELNLALDELANGAPADLARPAGSATAP